MSEAAITISSILFALFTLLWGVRSYINQMNAQLFLEFTKRFEEVMQSFPKNAWAMRTNLTGKLPVESEELSLAVLRYLNLCSEEYYLYKKGWLNRGIWKIWEGELVRTLRTPLFIREWKKLSCEFDAYLSFKEYVSKLQENVER